MGLISAAFLIGAAVAGYEQVNWIAVPLLAMFYPWTMADVIPEELVIIPRIRRDIWNSVFGWFFASLKVGAAFMVGRGISLLA